MLKYDIVERLCILLSSWSVTLKYFSCFFFLFLLISWLFPLLNMLCLSLFFDKQRYHAYFMEDIYSWMIISAGPLLVSEYLVPIFISGTVSLIHFVLFFYYRVVDFSPFMPLFALSAYTDLQRWDMICSPRITNYVDHCCELI